ncbi:MAG: hypothetical protein OEW91_09195, partial [Acidimicrobiia bacterium]|nr:hypothetical protein [Acidimicrobiia bacterium]
HEGDPTPDLITIKYLEALQGVANGKATKIFLPLDTSGVLGSVAAIGELFKEGNGGAASAEPAAVPKRSGGDRTPPGPTAAQQMPPASAPRPDQPGR